MSNKVISTFIVPIPQPFKAKFPSTHYLKQERQGLAEHCGKIRRKHFLGNKIEPLVSYLCPFQLWSSGGTSPCRERRSCRWRQRPASERGRRCGDPCRSGTSAQTWAGLGWASLQSGSLQSCSAPCSGRPNGWHLQRKSKHLRAITGKQAWCEAEFPPSLLTPLHKQLLKLFLH